MEIDSAAVVREDALIEVQVQVEVLQAVWRNRRISNRQPEAYCSGAIDALDDVVVILRRLIEAD